MKKFHDHAIKQSTASVMVQSWHSMSSAKSSKDENADLNENNIKVDWELTELREKKENDDNNEGDSNSSYESSCANRSAIATDRNEDENEDFLVRQLLSPGRVPENLKGRQGAASACVDTVIRLETVVAILASFFMLGLGEVPFRILSISTTKCDSRGIKEHFVFEFINFFSERHRIVSAMSFAWIFWSLLHGIWALFLRHHRPTTAQKRPLNALQSGHVSSVKHRQQSFIKFLDLIVMIGMTTTLLPTKSKWKVLMALIFLTGKSFIQTMQKGTPKLIRRIFVAIEFAIKMMIIRVVVKVSSNSDDIAVASSVLAIIWSLFVVCNKVPTQCEANPQQDKEEGGVADVCFLGHPAELSDCYALWLLPYSLDERWRPHKITNLLWPLHFLIGWYCCNYRQKLFGDQASFFCCDDVNYGKTRMQTWIAAHFGRHFVTRE